MIVASVESSGLSFYAQMSNGDWRSWIGKFKLVMTKVIGFDVGEPEEIFI
ncbi:hypothetical protein [Cytobacillus praedii]|nr:hypothetical protein [Cytobacillus praedii]